MVGDMVFIKVSRLKMVMRFGAPGKLAPRFVGLFQCLERIRKPAYQAELANKMARVHDMFHVLHLRRCLQGTATIVEPA